MDAARIDPITDGVLVAERYRVGRRIGRGGMGSVFEAWHEVTGKRVALKVMSVELSEDEKLVARFLREAKASATVQHPNAIEVLDVFHHEHTPVMVMELLEGKSLADHLETAAPLGPGELARILVPVAAALGHAHALGIVHRDVKPDNIFLSQRDGTLVPKVLDFGIAKILRETPGHDTMRLTSTGAMMGTPYYMAPEQAAGRTDLDHRADVWALGVLMYEAVTGQVPFRGENFGQVFAQILQEDPPPAASRADVPAGISDVIERALEKKAAKRLGSMQEIIDALTPFLEHVDAPLETRRAAAAQIGRRVSRTTSLADTAPQVPGAVRVVPPAFESIASPEPAPVAANEARPRWPLALGGVLVVAIAIAAIVALSMGGPSSTSVPSVPVATVAPTIEGAPVVASPPSPPPQEIRLRAFRSDRLGDAELGFGVTGEPVPVFTVDSVVQIEPPDRGISLRRVVLGGSCLGHPADLVAGTTCVVSPDGSVEVAASTAPVETLNDPPTETRAGTWAAAQPTPCAGEPRADTGLFDAEVCVPGGFFFLGDERFRPNACTPRCAAFPERPIVMSPFFIDAYEVTVGRWRAALANGWNPPDAWWPRRTRFCTYRADGSNDALPMNCVTWEGAREFCAQDGRELVSEARWEFVATGLGRENLYVGGDTAPSCIDAVYARLGATLAGEFGLPPMHQVGGLTQCAFADPSRPEDVASPEGVQPVGSVLDQAFVVPLATETVPVVYDLAGNLQEWALDEAAMFDAPCWATEDGDPVCGSRASAPEGTLHTLRGGSWAATVTRTALGWRDARPDAWVDTAGYAIGFRCARRGTP